MRKFLTLSLLVCALAALILAGPAAASTTGGASFQPPPPPPKKAKIVRGKAIAPRGAPRKVRQIIKAGNRIIGKPYKWGGGHASFSRLDSGYDCSGSVSYALRGARLIRSPMASGGLMSWGRRGTGKWVTVYAHGGHAYMVVAGLRLDTSMRDNPRRTGPQWSKRLRKSSRFRARHPRGL
jgi:hypothetical protein